MVSETVRVTGQAVRVFEVVQVAEFDIEIPRAELRRWASPDAAIRYYLTLKDEDYTTTEEEITDDFVDRWEIVEEEETDAQADPRD